MLLVGHRSRVGPYIHIPACIVTLEAWLTLAKMGHPLPRGANVHVVFYSRSFPSLRGFLGARGVDASLATLSNHYRTPYCIPS